MPSPRSQTPHMPPRGPPTLLPSLRTRPSTLGWNVASSESWPVRKHLPLVPTPPPTHFIFLLHLFTSLCLPSSTLLYLSSCVLGIVSVIQREMRENYITAFNRFLIFFSTSEGRKKGKTTSNLLPFLKKAKRRKILIFSIFPFLPCSHVFLTEVAILGFKQRFLYL